MVYNKQFIDLACVVCTVKILASVFFYYALTVRTSNIRFIFHFTVVTLSQ